MSEAEVLKTTRQRMCDFCGKTQHEAAYLIVAPGEKIDICDACVAECARIIAEREAAKASA